MSQCPVCHAPIRDDFGLLECDSCGAQLIVHMDGRVEAAGAQESASEPTAFDFGGPEEPPPVPVEPVAVELAPVDEPVMPEDPLDADDPIAPEPEPDPDPDPEAEAEPEPETEFTAGPAADPSPEPSQIAEVFAEPPVDPDPEVYVPPNQNAASPDLSDLERFANSEVSGGNEGSLRYTVFVAGIDTAELRLAFREAITDRKFLWDTDQILRSIRHGQVRIADVPATKAFILISRLKSMPVHIRWEQYAIHQP